jgi:hypothetical protein
MRSMLGYVAPTKKLAFLGKKDAVEVKKLSGLEVKEFQAYINVDAKTLPESDQGLAIQRKIVRLGVVGAAELTDEEIDSFPLDEVSKLAKEVLIYSGINPEDKETQGND